MPDAPKAPQAAGDANQDQTAPTWLTAAVAGVWGKAEWVRWETRVRPALAERGVTVEMLEPLYGPGGSDLVGIAARPPAIGWRAGWTGEKRGRASVLRAAGELIRELDRPRKDDNGRRTRTPGAQRNWLRRRATT
jgi:hypothetical protein